METKDIRFLLGLFHVFTIRAGFRNPALKNYFKNITIINTESPKIKDILNIII